MTPGAADAPGCADRSRPSLEDPTGSHPIPVHLTVSVPGVHLPTWSVFALVGAFILSAVMFLLTIQEMRSLREESESLRREIRMLQIHTQDIESVLIRNGSARRSDFAPWMPGDGRQKEERSDNGN